MSRDSSKTRRRHHRSLRLVTVSSTNATGESRSRRRNRARRRKHRVFLLLIRYIFYVSFRSYYLGCLMFGYACSCSVFLTKKMTENRARRNRNHAGVTSDPNHHCLVYPSFFYFCILVNPN
ncbi:hypothetical protein HanIR_Chr17g0846951 [Helianthus annuus]|nr:hypothetical protein HanIR_Chr17g0846951 [Helianthus annuus]